MQGFGIVSREYHQPSQVDYGSCRFMGRFRACSVFYTESRAHQRVYLVGIRNHIQSLRDEWWGEADLR